MNAVPTIPVDHLRKAEALVKETHTNGGLAPLDLERWWADEEISRKDPFGKDIPQVPLGIRMSVECVYDELGIEEDFWRFQNDADWAHELKVAYNDKAEKIVGRRLLGEGRPDPTKQYPAVKKLHDVFEAENKWHSGSWWLHQSANNEDELKALLDRVEARDIRKFILPENWEEEKARLMAMGIKPGLYRGQRGPVTFATSVYGVENLIYLIADDEDLAARFRDAILNTMLEIARILDEEAGYTPEAAPHGFGWCDDNCCLLNPTMYEFFGYPILQGMFDRYSPNPEDRRGQHSDSAMAHLLPILHRADLTHANFGPTVKVSEIREHLPNAIIQGQLAPFTFSRNEELNIVLEFIRDFEQARDKRGLWYTTAGSINNGSRLTGMRLLMAAIQRYGRYNEV